MRFLGRHSSRGTGLDFETLRLREAAHISKEFGSTVADEALRIVNSSLDPEAQYYSLMALARRHAEPNDFEDETSPTQSSYPGRVSRLLTQVDRVIEMAAPHLQHVPPETVVGVGFAAMTGVCILGRKVIAENPVALVGFIGSACMFTSFSRQLIRQAR